MADGPPPSSAGPRFQPSLVEPEGRVDVGHERYERKGNLVKAKRVQARLAELQDAAPR